MDETVAQTLDLIRRQGLHGDIWMSRQEMRRLEMLDGAVRDTGVSQYGSLVVRVWEDGRVGQASTTVTSELRQVVEMARLSARYGGEGAPFEEHLRSVYPSVMTYDPAVDRLGLAELGTRAAELNGAAREAVHGEMTLRTELSRTTEFTWYAATTGASEMYTRTEYGAQQWASTASRGEILQFWNYSHSGQLLEPAALTDPLRMQFRNSRREGELPGGTYPGLLSPRVVVNLLQPLQRQVNGRTFDPQKESTSLGPLITLWDNPLVDHTPGSAPFDDEGIPTARKLLYDRGRQVGLLTDVEARRQGLGEQPGGNGYRFVPGKIERDVTALPQPWMSNLVMEPGAEPREALLSRIGEGIWIEQLSGHGVSSDVLQGQVKVGWVVRGGEVVGRLRNAAVRLSLMPVLKGGLGGLSSERSWTGGGRFLLPYALVEGIQVFTQSH